MAGSFVYFEYGFMFAKEANIWTRIADFEKDLADFLAAYGLVAEIVVPVGGNAGKGILLIKRLDNSMFLTNPKGVQLTKELPKGKRQKSANVVKNLTARMK